MTHLDDAPENRCVHTFDRLGIQCVLPVHEPRFACFATLNEDGIKSHHWWWAITLNPGQLEATQ